MIDNSTNPEVIAVDFDPFNGSDLVLVAAATELQTKIWMSYTLGETEFRAFNESASIRFRGISDQSVMELALQTLIRRHDALRTVFSADGKQICVYDDLPVNLLYQDISPESDFKKKQLVAAYTEQEAAYRFDLVRGPLFRAVLIKLAEQEYHLILTAHRIIVQGWSVERKAQELNTLYAQKVAIRNRLQKESTHTAPLHQLLARTAAEFPQQTAVLFQGRCVSYRELDQTANRVARHLAQKGVKPGDIVGVALDRSPDLLVILLAVMKAGAAYMPLDANDPQERIAFMLTDSAASALVTSKAYAGRFKGRITELAVEEVLGQSANYPNQVPDVPVTGDDLAYVRYTSGSTGTPNGVLIEHHSLVNLLNSLVATPGISADDRLLAVSTMSFDMAVVELYLPLLVGATVVLADTATAQDGHALLQLMQAERVSIMQATPATWQMMLGAGWDKSLSLKALCGGETLPRGLAEKLLARCNEVWYMYGAAETTIWSTSKKISSTKPITIGRPIPNTKLYVLDEGLQPVADGEVGELYVGGDGVARGYINQPELTNTKFIKSPFDSSDKERLYRTGDLGKRTSDGEIDYLGRVDHQVRIGGYRVEPGEIESVLRSIGEINQAVVSLREDRPGDRRLVGYVVLGAKSAGTTVAMQQQVQSWKQFLRARLPEYMIPQEFVVLTELPLMPNGTIDRKALPKPAVGEVSTQTGPAGPRTDAERLVADVWRETLGMTTVTIYDNFFEVGGHSLSAVQMMVRLEKATGKRLPPATLFEHSTIEKLAKLLPMENEHHNWSSLVLLKPGVGKVPLYIVHGANSHVLQFNTLALNMDPEQPVYGLQAKGINEIDEPLTTIEEMASHYISEILAANPNGPYALAGFSFGGMVAYEMARQLLAKGKEVKLLGMLDAYALESNRHDSDWKKRIDAIKFSLNSFVFFWALLVKDPYGAIEYKLIPMKRRFNLILNLFGMGEKINKANPHGYSMRLYRIYDQAVHTYKLVPLPVKITLFRAKRRRVYEKDLKFLGWKPYALKGIDIHEIPGEHGTLFSNENVKEFARTVQNVLDSHR